MLRIGTCSKNNISLAKFTANYYFHEEDIVINDNIDFHEIWVVAKRTKNYNGFLARVNLLRQRIRALRDETPFAAIFTEEIE